jgi:hypothetical protein
MKKLYRLDDIPDELYPLPGGCPHPTFGELILS